MNHEPNQGNLPQHSAGREDWKWDPLHCPPESFPALASAILGPERAAVALAPHPDQIVTAWDKR